MTERRADYASTRPRANGAWVESVEEESPAWVAGIEAGMRIDEVNGHRLRDVIDWRWEADGSSCDLVVYDPSDDGSYRCTLERVQGEDWGIDFSDVLFDGIRTCVNACQFCFMSMLPEDMRPSLTLRDDDYRLSFLQGNFVTLTNLTDDDVERIITCRLEPMNVSIHAVSPEVRQALIGRNAQRGIDVLERLCEAGIEVHGQIVLCPGVNDGDELVRTLDWVEEHPRVTSLAVVPLGYTKHSRRFTRSYSDDVEAARSVIGIIAPYQARARARWGQTRFQLSDEFYVDAHVSVPPAETYDGYPQYYDGIGMLRSFLDDVVLLRRQRVEDLAEVGETLAATGRKVVLVCGEAARETVDELCACWEEGLVTTLAIRNDFFGGDVNVTGLIVAEDLLAQLPSDLSGTLVVLPETMFNFDHVTLDGASVDDLTRGFELRGAGVIVSQTSPDELVDALAVALAE